MQFSSPSSSVGKPWLALSWLVSSFVALALSTPVPAVCFQSNSKAASESQASPSTAASTTSADEQALRRRAEDLYALMQLGRWDEAENFISSDSREYFHRAPKSAFLGFQIGAVKLGANGQEAEVDLTMQIVTSNAAAPGPFSMPQTSHWRRIQGLWYMVVPAPGNQGAQSAGLSSKQARQPEPMPEELKFKGHRFILGNVQADQVETARFPFTNVADHVVTLSVLTGCDCLQLKTTKKEYKPGESGDLVIEFNPKGYERQYLQTILVKTEPGDRETYLTVTGFVVPLEGPHVVRPEGHPRRKGTGGSKRAPTAPSGAS